MPGRPNLNFPKQFLDAKRWLVRMNGGKQSMSPHEKRPMEYEPPAGDDDPSPTYWRWRWSVPAVLASYEQAKSYWDRHPKRIEGLTFVLHPFGQHEARTRLICIDSDKALDSSGALDPEIGDLVDLLDSYTEFSKSGLGLHTFLLVDDCPAFCNLLQRPYGRSQIDLLCSNPVNVTGRVMGGHAALATIPFSTLEALPFFEYKEPKGANQEKPEWWTDDPLDGVPEHLAHFIPQMEMATALEGQGGSLTLFAAACRLMRHGVVGREAEALLRCVPAEPEFPSEQIQRTAECAYNQTTHDGEFDNPTPEFPVIDTPPPPVVDDLGEEDREKRYGFNFMSMAELDAADLTLEYLVDGAFTGDGALFIGGREKTFKTGIAADLLISLATQTPFLGHFQTLSRRRSVLFTAEIGMARAKTLVKGICASRGLSLRQVEGFDLSDGVPSFKWNTHTNKPADETAIRKLKLFLTDRKPEVAIFDPLYFAMGGAAVGDMYEIGEVLRHITKICKDHDVWPIFCHHAKKDANKEFDPMDLNDFYGSGVGAFARQWILLSHAEPFRNGIANLYANIGGSSQGDRGIFEVQIDEGQADILSDRRWDVTVGKATEEKGHVSRASILRALDGIVPISPTELAIHVNCVGQEPNLHKILHQLVREGEVTMRNKKFQLALGEFND